MGGTPGTMPSRDSLLKALEGLPVDAQAHTLRTILAEVTRRGNMKKYPTPGALACSLDNTLRQTPALRLIDRHIVRTIREGGRLIVTVPPQEGKSSRVAIWTPIWALVRNPKTRIVTASYAESLARRNSQASRAIVREFGSGARDETTGLPTPDRLGISVADGLGAATSWAVSGRTGGGYYATGVGGSLTGRSADLLIIDDPVKNMVDADSAREREKVWEWWTAVAQTRLSPGAAVIVIMTRWNEDDLAGRIIAQDRKLPAGRRNWTVVNIPAVAEPGVPDALNREPGEPLVSARGRTAEQFEKIRQDVGPRTWSALYQGAPTPPGGGLFRSEDFNRYRRDTPPLVGKIVTVDPAESGHGDEAGLLSMGWDAEGTVYVTEDASGQMRSDQWARTAVLMALRQGATEILYEAFTAKETYARVLRTAWDDIRDQVRMIDRCGGDAGDAVLQWAEERGGQAKIAPFREALEVAADVRQAGDDPPYRVTPWTARGDKVARAAGARQSTETGRLRMGGTFRVLELQATTWQPGQGSPDRVDAMVNGHDHIVGLLNRPVGFAVPEGW